MPDFWHFVPMLRICSKFRVALLCVLVMFWGDFSPHFRPLPRFTYGLFTLHFVEGELDVVPPQRSKGMNEVNRDEAV